MKRQDLIGHGLFIVFPENPYNNTVKGTEDLRASLWRVLHDRTPDVMGVQKYDIPLHDGTDRFEVRYWSPVNTPILGPDGRVTHILHHVEDVTAFIQLQQEYSMEKGGPVKKVEALPERIEAEILRRAVEVKEANRKLKAALEGMEQCNIEMATNAQKLEAARKALEASKKQIDIYMDLMSHDINNMNQIAMSFLEIALQSIKLDDSEQELLKKPLSTLESISLLISHISKLRKSGEGLSKENYDLCASLLDVIADYSNVPGRDVTINYRPVRDCLIFANDLVVDVFSNLIGNSIKHSDPNVPLVINVRVERVREDDKAYYRVSVEDNGMGIPDEFKDRSFNKFERGMAKVSGKGLGLFLVKTLVEDFNGNVWIENRVPGDYSKGARFVVLLPAVENRL